MRFLASLKQDIKFQFRHGFYFAYLFVLLIYSLILINLPKGPIRTNGAVFYPFFRHNCIGFFLYWWVGLIGKESKYLRKSFCYTAYPYRIFGFQIYIFNNIGFDG